MSDKKLGAKVNRRKYISRETLEGIRITVKSFTKLGPRLLQDPGAKYLLSEVFSQDPLERYFSKQRHRGGSSDNPTVDEFRTNTATLIQQQSVQKDLKTMNVEASCSQLDVSAVHQPLPKRRRLKPFSTYKLRHTLSTTLCIIQFPCQCPSSSMSSLFHVLQTSFENDRSSP